MPATAFTDPHRPRLSEVEYALAMLRLARQEGRRPGLPNMPVRIGGKVITRQVVTMQDMADFLRRHPWTSIDGIAAGLGCSKSIVEVRLSALRANGAGLVRKCRRGAPALYAITAAMEGQG